MFDELTTEPENTPTPAKRQTGLTVICILTFIFSGLSLLSYLFYSLYYNFLPELIQSSPFTKYISGVEGMEAAIKTLTETNIWFFILNTLLYSASLTGAIMMFKLKKIGFHFYTVAQILLLIIPMIYMAGYKTDIASTMISGMFIFLYYTNLRFMK
jgi:hypothetical protein